MGSYPTVSPLPFGYKGGLFSVALFRRLSAPRRYLAVCPVELGLSSMGPYSRPTATIGPTTSYRGKGTGARGLRARLYLTKRRMRRPTLSVVARGSQKPSCAPKTSCLSRPHSFALTRSGSMRTADSATIPRS